MGEMPIFTPEQKLVFDQVRESDFLRKNFYFTGGTALSVFYLQHRYSEDLDFFSENEFSYEEILSQVQKWAQKLNFSFKAESKEVVKMFFLDFENGVNLKIDFGYYPYKRVEKGLIDDGLEIDSLLDIAINKLSTVNQRSSAKDFVDLYYLLQKFTLWDLIEGVKIKFRMELDPWLLVSDLEYVAWGLETLPKMIKPLTLDELKTFFREKAKELGKRAVEP